MLGALVLAVLAVAAAGLAVYGLARGRRVASDPKTTRLSNDA
jgi:hypothetical protein